VKKLLFLIAFIYLVQIRVQAQTNIYHPFPDSNAVWRQNSYYPIPCSHGLGGEESKYQYTIGGDTIINPYTYKKIYASGSDEQCGGFGSGGYYNYVGGLRQDLVNKKVYFKYANYPDTLLYDFSKQIGDTLRLAEIQYTFFYYGSVYLGRYTSLIASIDSVLVGGSYYKQFHLKDTCNNCYYDNFVLIEGVGSIAGLLEGFQYLDPTRPSVGSQLVCFSNNTHIYPSDSTSCSLITYNVSIEKSKEKKTIFKIYPNPSNGSINITITNAIDELKVTDLLGQIVYETKPQATNTTLQLDNAGVYFIAITCGKETSVKKVVVNK
jgi:hypothetical protein